jgi:hypothetical protein
MLAARTVYEWTGARETLLELQMDCHILPLRIRILGALQML